MFSQLKPAILMTLVLTVLTGLLYPLAVTGLSQLLFAHQANGSLIVKGGATAGSELIGQNFARPEYFHPRPSAAGANGYDATASSGSNLGPTNPDLAKRLSKDAKTYQAENKTNSAIPADAITTSGSGLDPDISPQNAAFQVSRIAAARHVSAETIQSLVQSDTQGRQFGFLGEPRANVLKLNLDLDRRFPLRQ